MNAETSQTYQVLDCKEPQKFSCLSILCCYLLFLSVETWRYHEYTMKNIWKKKNKLISSNLKAYMCREYVFGKLNTE